MPELGRYARELRARLWKPSVLAEVRDEIAAHLEMLERDLVARGLSPDAARDAARARFGDVRRIEDSCRDEAERRDRGRWLADRLAEMRQDGRAAVRQIRLNPRFALVTTLTLAIGLGAATVIFGIADAVLLRPLPFLAPDRLVVAWATTPAGQPFSVSQPDYLDLRARVRRLADLATFEARTPNLRGPDGPEQLQGSATTASFFHVLGVAPALGRAFTAEEDAPGGDQRVAVISDRLWARRFARDRGVIGRTIDLDGVAHRVVGVMPSGFDFPGDVDVWTPLAPSPAWPRGDRRLDALVGRLAAGATVAQAAADLRRVATALGTEHPTTDAGWGADARPFVEWYVSPELRVRVITLLAAVGLLLLMACVNVASLLLSRAQARQQALAVRAALGAGRGRIVRQLLTESVALALLGGAAGVVLAAVAVPAVRATGTAAVSRLADLAVDWRLVAFALGACVATGVAFGLAPALGLARAAGGVHGTLRSGRRVAAAGGVRSALIVASVALATLMLVGAGLVGGSFARLLRVDLGFRTEHVLTGSIVLPEERYDAARAVAFDAALVARLRAIPGVRAAGTTNMAPYSGGNTAIGWAPAERAPSRTDEYRIGSWRIVTPGYFDALGVPLVRGRPFDARDTRDAPRVILVNRRMADLGWPGADPVGRQVALGNKRTVTIVGVVGDARLLSVDSAPAPTIYYAASQVGFPTRWVTVRTTGDPAALAAAVRRVVASLDPELPLARVQPLAKLVSDATAQPRLTMLVFAIFAAAALSLAAIGLYGLISYTVLQRTREIGVRLALGAVPRRIVRDVLGDGLRLAGAGVALGGAAAYAGAGLLRAILFEVSPTDPRTFAGVALVLLAVAALASMVPARRASRLDPGLTLRAE